MIAFEKPLTNTTHVQARKGYNFTAMEDTKSPTLDRVITQNLGKEVKEAYAGIAKLPTLT